MALVAIEKVREAEVSARENLLLSEKEAADKVALASDEANAIISKALEKAAAESSSKEERANKKADEILVTAHNSSYLECEELRRNSLMKQDIINKKILKLIIDN